MATIQSSLIKAVPDLLRKAKEEISEHVQKKLDAAHKVTLFTKCCYGTEFIVAGTILKARDNDAATWLRAEGTKRFDILVMGLSTMIDDGNPHLWEIRHSGRIRPSRLLNKLRRLEKGDWKDDNGVLSTADGNPSLNELLMMIAQNVNSGDIL